MLIYPVWKNIKAPLIEYMEQMKTKRLDRKRKAIAINVLRAYKISSLPWTEVMPEPVDFCTLPEIKAVLRLPNDAEVDESTFSDILPKFPEMFDRWRGDIRRLLIKRFKKAQIDQFSIDEAYGRKPLITRQLTHASDDEVISIMALATTVFKCLNCQDSAWNVNEDPDMEDIIPACHMDDGSFPDYPLFYPKVLGHHCLTVATDSWADIPGEDNPDPSVRLDIAEDGRDRYRKPWSCRCLAVDANAGKMAEQIIRACGLDPLQATAEEMDALDPRLACLDCAIRYTDKTVSDVYSWRSAVSADTPTYGRCFIFTQ
jgi:hypothetical protein